MTVFFFAAGDAVLLDERFEKEVLCMDARLVLL